MKIFFGQDATTDEFISALEVMNRDQAVKSIVVFSSDKNSYDLNVLDSQLKMFNKPIFGGVFTGLLYEGEKFDTGTMMLGLPVKVSPILLENIGDPDRELDDELEAFTDQVGNGGTIAVFVDGLSPGVEMFKQALFENWGLLNNYIGGGAGSLSFKRTPCIISNKGFLGDCAVAAKIDLPSGIGVAHGWQPVSEALKVTESDRNKIFSLNWEPAFSVYKTIVEEISGRSFDNEDFFSIAKGYPFGISKMADEMVVRDPISLENNTAMICVGEVPQNSFVHILKGENQALIAGAEKAKWLAYESFRETYHREPGENRINLFIDCISRVLFLEDDFNKELAIVGKEKTIGALTLGEIANTGKSFLEFYNKTSVVGVLEG